MWVTKIGPLSRLPSNAARKKPSFLPSNLLPNPLWEKAACSSTTDRILLARSRARGTKRQRGADQPAAEGVAAQMQAQCGIGLVHPPQHFEHAGAAHRAGALLHLVVRKEVQFKTGGDSTLLAVIPLTPFGSNKEDAPVLVMFGLRNPSKALAIQFYARSCGMTATEERVLRAFSDGLSPSAIAHRHEVAISTVRTQLSSIRIKAAPAT